jgi:hypothetical protein
MADYQAENPFEEESSSKQKGNPFEVGMNALLRCHIED